MSRMREAPRTVERPNGEVVPIGGDQPLEAPMAGPRVPSVKAMVAIVAVVVAGTILVFFGLGYLLGRIYL